MTSGINSNGLISVTDASLVLDCYEFPVANSILRNDLNQPATFELFVRSLPSNRDWLLAAGLGPALNLITGIRYTKETLDTLKHQLALDDRLIQFLADFRFSGEIHAIPEGTVVFANEPLLRVTARLIEANLVGTLLLNQINFQTALATKAARIVLAAGNGMPGKGHTLIDASVRRAHGTDAALKAARSSAIAGFGSTSNAAAGIRFGLRTVGNMSHTHVLAFPSEELAFCRRLEESPDATLVIDTYDVETGVHNAISAARSKGVELSGVRLDSGDFDQLSRMIRRLLDEAGFRRTHIVASGNLDEYLIDDLVRAGAPIDAWSVGTSLGTSKDSPVVDGSYKMVALWTAKGHWQGVAKSSSGKAVTPFPKQVFRVYDKDGKMAHDTVALVDESVDGTPLLVPVMAGGKITLEESLDDMQARVHRELGQIPDSIRLRLHDESRSPYEIRFSQRTMNARDTEIGF